MVSVDGHLRNEIKEAMREVLTEEQDQKIKYMDERVDELEEAIEEIPKLKEAINEIDDLIKTVNRTNKELLYILTKNQLKDLRQE